MLLDGLGIFMKSDMRDKLENMNVVVDSTLFCNEEIMKQTKFLMRPSVNVFSEIADLGALIRYKSYVNIPPTVSETLKWLKIGVN